MRSTLQNIIPSLGKCILLLILILPGYNAAKSTIVFYSDSRNYPYEFLDYEGQPAGYTIDILRAIADLHDLDLEIVLGNWPELFSMVTEGSCSEGCIMDLYYNVEREKIFDFSEPIEIAYDKIYTRESSKVTSLNNLRNKKVAVQERSAVSSYLTYNFKAIELVYANSEYDALKLLFDGKSDAAIVNEKVGEYITNHFGLSGIEATSYPINPKEYAFAVPKGNSELLSKINNGMNQLKESGRYSQIYTKWFGPEDITGIPAADVFLYGGLILFVIGLTVVLIIFQNKSLRQSIKNISTLNQRTSYELKYQSAFNSYMMANAPIGIAVTNANNKIIKVNEYFTDLFGYSEKESLNKDINELIVASRGGNNTAKTFIQLESKDYIRKETKRRHKDGSLIDIELFMFPLVIDNQKKGLFCFYLDISNRKTLEREIIKAKNKAEKLSEFKSQFLAQMSHEIRTPLSVIAGYLSIMEESDVNDLDVEEIIEAMREASARIIRTIELMLNYSEVRNGIYEPEPKKMHLCTDIIEKIVDKQKHAAEEKHIDIIYDNKAEHDDVFVDYYSASNIFDQILDNAIKYTNEGYVKVTVDENDSQLISEISDTGIGITPEYLSKIFEPFSQEYQGYTRNYDGNGLGLALVKKYCEINDVVIKVKSFKGKGTSFKIIFKRMNNLQSSS